MFISKRGFIVLAMAVAIAIPASVAVFGTDSATMARRRPVTSTPTTSAPVKTPSPSDYLTTQLEHYLTDDGIAYIRPGLHFKVNSVTVNAERKVVVDLNMLDDYDQPLDRNGKMTPGPISASFLIAWYDPTIRQLVNYNTRVVGGATQATTDSGGSWAELDMGHYVYTYGRALPSGFDQTKTHQVGIYGNRNLLTEINKRYYDNQEIEFRPDGGDVGPTERWDKIRQGACHNCHNQLALHGGQRRDVKLCVMCHNMQTSDPDTGNSVDFPVLVHKIHSGPNLETPYVIIGFGGSVHDYSEVTFPQDRRNCQNCHEGRNASQKPTQSEVWYTYPSRRVCGTCHDHVDFETGEDHAGGPQADDSACAKCHVPESENEFDPSIKGAHTIPVKSKQLAGLNVEILGVSNTAPGESPTVVFKFTNDDGSAVDGSSLNRFGPFFAGPTTSYRWSVRETNRASEAVFDAETGTTTYTFAGMVPEDATGSIVFTGDFYRNVTVKDGQGNDISVRETAKNPFWYASVDGSPVKARREVALINNCNNCHDRLAFHGGSRYFVQECVICHRPNATTDEDEPPVESISFNNMIHRIHTGEELLQHFQIGSHNFNEVTFPGNRAVCTTCHTSNGYQLPVAFGADPVETPSSFWSPQGPGTASCLGCHDNQDAAAHAYLMTAYYPGSDKPAESCGSCHGGDATWSVDRVHAQ